MPKKQKSSDEKRSRTTRAVIVLIILVLLLLLCGLLYVLRSLSGAKNDTPAIAGVKGVEYVFQAFGGGALGDMELPYDVAYDGDNTIYVTVPDEGNILAFDKKGRNGRVLVHDAKAKGDGKKSVAEYSVLSPMGIDVGDDGLIYVADRTKMAVVVFNADGEKVREIPAMSAKGVEVSKDRLYILSDTGTLYVTDLKGNPLGQWGTYGREPDQISGASASTVDADGNIYISDLDNYRITALRPDLETLWQYGHPVVLGVEEDTRVISSPASITLGGDGNLYVVDGLVSQIVVLDKTGKVVSKPLGEQGLNDDQFFFPKGIDWMQDDLFVIADTFHSRIVGVRLTPQPLEGQTTSK